jgi:hypothetical protein
MNLLKIFLFILLIGVLHSSTYASITLFQHANFQGVSQVLGAGKHNFATLNKGVRLETSSVKVPLGCVVTLYTGDNCTGTSTKLYKDTSSVGSTFNDRVKSVLVEYFPETTYPVVLYEHSNSDGIAQYLPIGKHDITTITAGVGNDRVSSVRVSKANGKKFKVTLYADAGFKGNTLVLTESSSYIGDSFNDKTSSVVIEEVKAPTVKGVTVYGAGAFTGAKTDIKQKSPKFDGVVGSISVEKNHSVILYTEENYKGDSIGIGASKSDVSLEALPPPFNKTVRSVVVTSP